MVLELKDPTLLESRAFVAGKWEAGARQFSVTNPATGEEIVKVADMGVDDMRGAIDAAYKAQKAWARRTAKDRCAILLRWQSLMLENADDLAKILTAEMGKPLAEAKGEIAYGASFIQWFAEEARRVYGDVIPGHQEDKRIVILKQPIGVVGSITPWNFPVMIAIWHIMPAIRAGNTVVVKPSPFTPLSTLRMVEIMAGILPPGVVNVVTGLDLLGAAMSEHPGIDKISFTGSIATGQKIMSAAAHTLKKLTLELGGNDAGIVLPDADPKQIAEGLFWGAFINGGQTCAALKRLYVHDSIYEDVCAELVNYARNIPMGDGLDDRSVLGPIQNERQFRRVSELVDDARAKGGRVLLGGQPSNEGFFYPVTIVADVDHGVRLVDEEQFGPVLPVIRYSDVDAVIARANDNPNGLGGSVWSKDLDRAKSYALKLECGSAWINKHGAIQPNAPFGGVKSSGIGVSFGEEGLKEYTNVQTVFC